MDEQAVDRVFKALADPTRRLLLDRLRRDNGRTLRQLCEQLDMARQSVTQHLDLLVDAGLVVVMRRGRERLHYLDPTPLREIDRRWITAFDRPRLEALDAIRARAEENIVAADTTVPDYVYVTYIKATAEQVWRALTDADLTAAYWGHANVSDWQPGSVWEHRRTDGSGIVDVTGRVVAAQPPTRLVITFDDTVDPAPGRESSVVTFLVETHQDIVRLTVTHEKIPDPAFRRDISAGWPAIVANLKSLLETGRVLPQEPWSMDLAADRP
ncbi:ArsR/SmtB family transcription factor [Nocardia takedensis]|uniref:ArsR/SmtB family transcription factor n=1 Tax=Nocardia takedensis TaxID=259390 RepID=UPI0002ED6D7B|nr:metalloregulator ArsR/SmtB family transcription factor [Nocardia takedensis]